MKYASAMKYGGELVDAVDCDYDSFKELISLCPNCKEPVFLRTGGQRESVKGKAYQIGPHWCHFKGVSKEQVAGCELRVNGYTEKDRAKIAAQARGQRLKLLQRWFWRVWESKCKNSVGDYSLSISLSWTQSNMPSEVREALPNALAIFFQEMDLLMQEPMKINLSMVDDVTSFYGQGNANLRDAKVSLEAIQYLAARKNHSLTIDCFLATAECIYQTQQEVFKCGHQDLDEFSPEIKDSMIKLRKSVGVMGFASRPSLIAKHVEAFIFTIPWASEFQRLESEAQQRKEAA